jgi:hypothetical protein
MPNSTTCRPWPGATGGALIPISEFLAPFGVRFIATYPDYMEIGRELHLGASALFALFALPPPSPGQARVAGPLVIGR